MIHDGAADRPVAVGREKRPGPFHRQPFRPNR